MSQYEVQQGKQETACQTLEDSSPRALKIAQGIWVGSCGQYDYSCLLASDATNRDVDRTTGSSQRTRTFIQISKTLCKSDRLKHYYADHTLSRLMISDDNKMIHRHAPSYLYDLLKPWIPHRGLCYQNTGILSVPILLLYPHTWE